MNEQNKEIHDLDLEYEYKTRKLSGEKIDIDDFLARYTLEERERQQLIRRLQRWEKSMKDFEEYVKSFDFDAVFHQILSELELPTLWETAIRILKSVQDKSINLKFGPAWERVPVDAHLSTRTLGEQDIISKPDLGERRKLTKGPLAGAEVELTPSNRLVIRLNRRVPKGSQLRFVDKDGQTLRLPVVRQLGPRGRAIYDLTDIPELPPFEIKLQEPWGK